AHDVAALEYVGDRLRRGTATVLVDVRSRPGDARQIERRILTVGEIQRGGLLVACGDERGCQPADRVVVVEQLAPGLRSAVRRQLGVPFSAAPAVALVVADQAVAQCAV